MKQARFATVQLLRSVLVALAIGAVQPAHAQQTCRNILSNGSSQKVCRQSNGDWVLVNAPAPAPAPAEDAAHEFYDQYGQEFLGLVLSYQGAIKCETRSEAWGDAANRAISDELNRSILQNVGPLDSPNSQEALNLFQHQFEAVPKEIDDNLTPDKCPGFNQSGGAEAVDEIIREDGQD